MRGGGAAGGEGGPQYDEIPYEGVAALAAAGVAGAGGHSGKGQLPQVPADYAQVPELPQRQGENKNSYTAVQSMLNVNFSQQKFWPCHENGLTKTIQAIPRNL